MKRLFVILTAVFAWTAHAQESDKQEVDPEYFTVLFFDVCSSAPSSFRELKDQFGLTMIEQKDGNVSDHISQLQTSLSHLIPDTNFDPGDIEAVHETYKSEAGVQYDLGFVYSPNVTPEGHSRTLSYNFIECRASAHVSPIIDEKSAGIPLIKEALQSFGAEIQYPDIEEFSKDGFSGRRLVIRRLSSDVGFDSLEISMGRETGGDEAMLHGIHTFVRAPYND